MSNKRLFACPEPTLRRLPAYCHFLREKLASGRDIISCTHISRAFKLDPTQVRKDLEVTGIVGKPKVGYEVRVLIDSIEEFLGWKNLTDAFLAGVGHLGMALLKYERFQEYGLRIVAGFDSDPSKIGQIISHRQVLSIAKLTDLALRMHIHIGIIAVPGEHAQSVAQSMIEGGVRAIWNFAPVNLELPDDVVLENVFLSSSLAVLFNRLRQRNN